MSHVPFHLLASGYDTIECAYYLTVISGGNGMDWVGLTAQRDMLRASKIRNTVINLSGEQFMLQSHGTKSGYPLLLENKDFSIQCGQFNNPNFFVTYSSFALWHCGLQAMHERFLQWAQRLGLQPLRPESLSRVDLAFDYHLPTLDFDEQNFVSKATKDNKHRKHGEVQTFRYGAQNTVLRLYNKSEEISESSHKTWFHSIWQREDGVWRIEWQVRKEVLRQLGIRTIEDLDERVGDLGHYLQNHTSLRKKTNDSNKSRWPLHPLWQDMAQQMAGMNRLGVLRDYQRSDHLDERLQRNAISIYGYLKRLAAIRCAMRQEESMPVEMALKELERLIRGIHDPLSWQFDVQKRIKEMEVQG